MPRPAVLISFCATLLVMASASPTFPQNSAQPAATSKYAATSVTAQRHSSKATGEPLDKRPAIVFVQAPTLVEGDLRNRFPQGSTLVRLPSKAVGTAPISLTPEFFAAADPEVFFDGTKILFAALEKPGTGWQIWEMNIDGSSKRRVTNCQADCLRPAYLAHDSLAFTVVRENAGRVTSEVHVALLDGTDDHPITFGPGNYQVETVLKDGRILVSAGSPLVPQGAGSTALYALRHDGTGLQSLRCDHRQKAKRTEASELADGTVVFVKTQGAKVGGELAMFRRGALHNSALSPLASLYWSPRPLDADKLIVARKTAMAAGVGPQFNLYAVDASTGRVDGLLYQAPKSSSVQAVPVAAHAVPRWFWSTLNPQAKSGYFICLDAYHSVDAPKGRITQPIAKVRVLTLDATAGQERSLGEAPVEKDGSFYVAVPPDKPMRFELLDDKGTVIKSQQSWIWTRRGEERGCVGCHEDKSVAPDNRWPLTLRRFDSPMPLGSEVDVKVEH